MSFVPHNEHSWQHQVNFREDEASTQGTRALRNILQSLHDAQHNPFFRPMVLPIVDDKDLTQVMSLPHPKVEEVKEAVFIEEGEGLLHLH